jgi:hypothetical protein
LTQEATENLNTFITSKEIELVINLGKIPHKKGWRCGSNGIFLASARP